MLQAYIDESCTDGQLFVMAGFLAGVDQWVRFSDEWEQLLRLGPPHFRRIDEFKMSSMMNSELAIEQSELFFRVAERHLDTYITCCIRIADVEAAYNAISWPAWLDNTKILGSTYFQAFQGIISALVVSLDEFAIEEPIDIVFDEHTDKVKCIRAWDIAKRWGHPSLVPRLGDTPSFRDSKKFMPLQAADMLAYWVRESAMTPDEDGHFELKWPWPIQKKLRGINIFYRPDMIRRNIDNAILASALLRNGVPPAIVSAALSPSPPVVESKKESG